MTREGGTSYTFVTEGIESALQQARAAAGNKDVSVARGANIVHQFLRAGLLDELQIHLAGYDFILHDPGAHAPG